VPYRQPYRHHDQISSDGTETAGPYGSRINRKNGAGVQPYLGDKKIDPGIALNFWNSLYLTQLIPPSFFLFIIMNNFTAHAGNGPKRPASLAELAEMAKLDLWDATKDFKDYLKIANIYRKEGKECTKKGDLEGAFVQLARAATLVLEKLPMHRDYNGMLNANQRQNLALVRISMIISFFTIHPLPLQSPCLFELLDHLSFPPLLNSRSPYHYRMDKISLTI
jgi:hypothetical protein